MSNADPQNPPQHELPRLRIHHFFVLTTVFAVVMSVHLGILHLIRALYPDAEIPELTTGKSLIYFVYTFPQSACITITLLGLAWRRRGGSFPSQPGHWMALYLTIVGAYEIVLTVLSVFPVAQAFGWDSTIWLTRPMGLIFQCFALTLWVAAYLHEPDRIWKLGWAAMALKSLFVVCRTLLLWGRQCVEWLLETYWYRHYHWQFPFFNWGPYANIISLLLPNYLLLAFLLAATVSDLRQHRQRHWSHWLVVVSTFVSTVIMTVYYHFALR